MPITHRFDDLHLMQLVYLFNQNLKTARHFKQEGWLAGERLAMLEAEAIRVYVSDMYSITLQY